jgi:hypothetical protein
MKMTTYWPTHVVVCCVCKLTSTYLCAFVGAISVYIQTLDYVIIYPTKTEFLEKFLCLITHADLLRNASHINLPNILQFYLHYQQTLASIIIIL